MFYYRYRAPTEVSFKELMYDEMYFSSPEECNDPFDSKTYYEFSKDIASWKRLLTVAWQKCEAFTHINVDKVALALAEISPITYSDVQSIEFSKSLLTILRSNTYFSQKHEHVIPQLIHNFQRFLAQYQMPKSYFVSFSKTKNEPLMWSHYSAKHEGFCLIFRAEEGHLKQCHVRVKKYVNRVTPTGIAPKMGWGMPPTFPFNDVQYVKDVKPLNAFLCFPSNVAGNVSEEEIPKFRSEQFEQYLQKHESWSYERESRISIRSPSAWLLGDHFDFSVQERLLHFEPTQLVGLILGARMNESVRLRLAEITQERQHRIAKEASHKRIISDFVVFEATLSHKSREIQVRPAIIFGLDKNITSSDKSFYHRLTEWEKGAGLCFEGGSATRVYVKP